jgi:hypothetical protein
MCYTRVVLILVGLFTLKFTFANFEPGNKDLSYKKPRTIQTSLFEKNS